MKRALTGVAIVFLIIGFAIGLVTGMYGQSKLGPEPASTTTSVTASSCLPSLSSNLEEGKQAKVAGLGYMRSAERLACYEKVWPIATKVAEGLIAGKFGPIKKYNDHKKPLTPDYVGWGGIAALDDSAYAWIYWSQGKVDLSKGVRGFSLGTVQLEAIDHGNGPYVGFLDRDTASKAVLTAQHVGVKEVPQIQGYEYPITLKELHALDEQLLQALEANRQSYKL